jgi:DNA uptake protein ComE-like DNA-binding protein
MSIRLIAAAATALLLITAPALAQTTAPAAKPAATTTAPAAKPAAKPKPAKTAVTQKVNINTATAAELDALPQIGEKRSEAIIKNRPYKTPDELVSKKVLSKGIYDKIKGSIVAR